MMFLRLQSLIGTTVLSALAIFVASDIIQSGEVPDATSDMPLAKAASVNAIQSSGDLRLPKLRPEVYYQAIIDRPLFSPTRRPLVQEAAVIEAIPEARPEQRPAQSLTPPDIRLAGTFGEDSARVALIEDQSLGVLWVAEGDVISGWTIRSISADSVEISLEDSTHRLELFE